MQKKNRPLLQVENVAFSFPKKKNLFSSLSFSLNKGDIAALVGKSGVGKTTLFELLTEQKEPLKGKISLHLEKQKKAPFSYLTQEDLLLPWRKAWENVFLPLELEGVGKKEGKKRALELLKEVGLEKWAYAYPDELSGGMRKRVAIARTFVLKKPLVLLDEPFSSLDVSTKKTIYSLLKRLCKKFSSTLLFISHDVADVLQLAEKLFVLHQGTILKEELFLPEKSEPLKYFLLQEKIENLLSKEKEI